MVRRVLVTAVGRWTRGGQGGATSLPGWTASPIFWAKSAMSFAGSLTVSR